MARQARELLLYGLTSGRCRREVHAEDSGPNFNAEDESEEYKAASPIGANLARHSAFSLPLCAAPVYAGHMRKQGT